MQLEVEAGWSDLVFHVLAHVDLKGLPANLYEPAYVAWAGASPELADDARVIAALLQDSSTANAVQPLAALFGDLAQARLAADRDLAELVPSQVARPEWLPLLASVPQAAELLRCQALLEAERHAALPPPADDLVQLHAELDALCACAPRLRSCQLRFCRALTWHGRAFGTSIYLGLPDPRFGVTSDHIAMQGAHEATVLEARERAAPPERAALPEPATDRPPLSERMFERAPLPERAFECAAPTERAFERVAVVVLAQRAAAVGPAGAYADWGARFGLRPEHTLLDALAPSERLLAQQLLSD